MTTHAFPTLSERYQEATDYTPQNVQGHSGLDFSAQPSPFKTWHQARRIVLAGGPSALGEATPGPVDATRLGRLLYHTYGVTLVREFPGMSMHYRAAPSAGGLYPTELYVAVREVEGIPDGIFAYDPRDHSLVVCWEGDFWVDLTRLSFDHPAVAAARVVLIGTGLWERSAWRYGDRAYRRVLLDTGHVFGNAVLAAVADGLRAVPIPDFHDEGVEGLLLLDDAREGVLLLAALLEEDAALGLPPAPNLASPVMRQASEPAEGAWIPALHRAGKLRERVEAQPYAAPRPDPVAALALPQDALATGACALAAIRRRRSTRDYAVGDVPLEILGRTLAHAYPRPDALDPVADLAPGVLDTWVIAAGVQGLASGVYRYDRRTHTLALSLQGNPRDALHRCCLWQELARDCAFAVVHTVDLPAAVAAYGERLYRTVHLEAGLIGQRINMAALRLGQGASGVGGFFDEFLRALLMLDAAHAIVYVTTVGVPA